MAGVLSLGHYSHCQHSPDTMLTFSSVLLGHLAALQGLGVLSPAGDTGSDLNTRRARLLRVAF